MIREQYLEVAISQTMKDQVEEIMLQQGNFRAIKRAEAAAKKAIKTTEADADEKAQETTGKKARTVIVDNTRPLQDVLGDQNPTGEASETVLSDV